MAISDGAYNGARKVLVDAGSRTASKSHDKHTQGKGSPDDHGKKLLSEARDDFRSTDMRLPNQRSGMTMAHYDAIHKAAQLMGIPSW
jgi:hypothetical protein